MTIDSKDKWKISHQNKVIHRLLPEGSPKAPWQPMNNFG
jgi:hypothetical protein